LNWGAFYPSLNLRSSFAEPSLELGREWEQKKKPDIAIGLFH